MKPLALPLLVRLIQLFDRDIPRRVTGDDSLLSLLPIFLRCASESEGGWQREGRDEREDIERENAEKE